MKRTGKKLLVLGYLLALVANSLVGVMTQDRKKEVICCLTSSRAPAVRNICRGRLRLYKNLASLNLKLESS